MQNYPACKELNEDNVSCDFIPLPIRSCNKFRIGSDGRYLYAIRVQQISCLGILFLGILFLNFVIVNGKPFSLFHHSVLI